MFSSAGSSIIPVTPNRQKESSRGNLPSVSSGWGEGRRRRKRRGVERGVEGEKKRRKTINIEILSSRSNPHVFSLFSFYNLAKRRASSFRFVQRIIEHQKNKNRMTCVVCGWGGGGGALLTRLSKNNKYTCFPQSG